MVSRRWEMREGKRLSSKYHINQWHWNNTLKAAERLLYWNQWLEQSVLVPGIISIHPNMYHRQTTDLPAVLESIHIFQFYVPSCIHNYVQRHLTRIIESFLNILSEGERIVDYSIIEYETGYSFLANSCDIELMKSLGWGNYIWK